MTDFANGIIKLNVTSLLPIISAYKLGQKIFVLKQEHFKYKLKLKSSHNI